MSNGGESGRERRSRRSPPLARSARALRGEHGRLAGGLRGVAERADRGSGLQSRLGGAEHDRHRASVRARRARWPALGRPGITPAEVLALRPDTGESAGSGIRSASAGPALTSDLQDLIVGEGLHLSTLTRVAGPSCRADREPPVDHLDEPSAGRACDLAVEIAQRTSSTSIADPCTADRADFGAGARRQAEHPPPPARRVPSSSWNEGSVRPVAPPRRGRSRGRSAR